MEETKYPAVTVVNHPVKTTGERANVNVKNALRQDPDDRPTSVPDSPDIKRWKTIEGYTCVRRDPYGYWTVHASSDGYIPQSLACQFTDLFMLEKAIRLYVGRRKDEKAEATA